uniref:Uncharacterized protein n=1 Tax=Rhizophora mucronata TaxID=61149 RepID=A0A2P2PYY3_RHIMU
MLGLVIASLLLLNTRHNTQSSCMHQANE